MISKMIETVWVVGIFYALMWGAIMANDIDYEGVEDVKGSYEDFVRLENENKK